MTGKQCEWVKRMKRKRGSERKWSDARNGGLFFFFQAEDGIRDYKVTGVQTCALPILIARQRRASARIVILAQRVAFELFVTEDAAQVRVVAKVDAEHVEGFALPRSEERRVGKECRSRWSPYH